ncbi:uncharacterized protein PGTG_12400 [Puccinia graminis f. sp. tritici CRL 75-36-700-3]|uniref:Uncharacterized protein n=1 Tax=Puccinia graminis f. sp. tritici (strain CRL 75-36-700-3 / race SCCL) TaxID=418459 RepID=E3KQ69_PUCGT|nr:uncharacterized protein PGTG_12400 [Puccinia graminis f. sp. tritici CRL 75-36-700-3]EFP86444.2 hypothetical protein PGTG_12400 [Puccinia graminis f. sp. tritici CRL 75-36-700-3]
MSTRSNNPDLHGPLPPALRPRRSKSAGGTGQPPQADYDPKEASASLSRKSDGGDIGRERLNHGSSYKSEHRDHTKDPKELGPSNSFCDYSPRSHGLGSSGAKNASPGHEPSDHSFGSDGRGSHSFNLFGGYPATPQIAGEASDSQKVLQKLIPRKELEEFVKGWNPWTIKKELFPTAPKKNDGKKRSSSSKGAKELYNDPNRWKQVMRGCNTLEAAYRHMAD